MTASSRSAARKLCGWVDHHIDSFRPSRATGLPLLERVKPLGDLLLVLWNLTSERVPPQRGEFANWAADVAGELWPHAERCGKSLEWESMPHLAAEEPFTGLALVIFQIFQMITGRFFDFHDGLNQTARILFGARNGLPLDLAFAADVFSFSDCRMQAIGKADSILESNAPRCSTDLYSLTHAIFYATWMGRRDVSIGPAIRVSWARRLAQYASLRAGCGDLDLAAELLLSQSMIYPRRPARNTRALQQLVRAAEEEGSIPPHSRLFRAQRGIFENRYHPTVVASAVLALAADGE